MIQRSNIINCAVLSCALLVSLPLQAINAPNMHVAPIKKQINLNTADAHALQHAVKGLGQKRATAIVAYRTANGSFKSIDALAMVHGFGQRFVQANLKQLQSVFTL